MSNKVAAVLFAALVALILAMIFAPLPALATEREARSGADWIRISDTPCSNAAVLAILQGQQGAEAFRSASAYIGGQRFEACWLRLANGAVGVLYEDGDTTVVPPGAFGPVRES